MKLVIVGGGFTGTQVAKIARAASWSVVATTRSDERARSLDALGVTPLVAPALDAESLAPHVDGDTSFVVTMPPDPKTESAIAPLLAEGRSIAYVSSTGVYGDARGTVDETTPLQATTPRSVARERAERIWRDAGAVLVRAPGIYGPGRGVHLRLARGELRVAAEATNAISRIHVADLAAALFALCVHTTRDATYVIGDREPTPHADVVRFLCDALALPMPPSIAPDEVDESLRNDRRVDASRIRRDLGLTLAYPTYREGYAHCIAADREAIDAALANRPQSI